MFSRFSEVPLLKYDYFGGRDVGKHWDSWKREYSVTLSGLLLSPCSCPGLPFLPVAPVITSQVIGIIGSTAKTRSGGAGGEPSSFQDEGLDL